MEPSTPHIDSVSSFSRIKKQLTDMPSVVDDSLKGLVMSNKGLAILEGHRIVIRRDHTQMEGKVKLLTGGGAGQEPGYLGYIGPGMLTAAVLGEIFFAPASHTILCALRELGKNHTDGILVILANYAGHRLNFGIAIERARSEGNNVKMIVVGEDTAMPVIKVDGRRGLAGLALIHKIAGAMAEEGKRLDDIFETINSIVTSDIGTIGVGVKLAAMPSEISRCCIILGNHQLELGLGIHGEPGVHRIPSGNASQLVHTMLEHMMNPASKIHTELNSSFPVVLLINNFGASTKLEEHIFTMEVLKQLENKGYKVARTYAGIFAASLDIAGYSITLLNVRNPEILTYVDAPTSATAWPRTFCASSININDENLPISIPLTCPGDDNDMRSQRLNTGPIMSDRTAFYVTQVIRFAADALISCEQQLNQFDAEGGDGDTGSILKTGAIAIRNGLQTDMLPVKRPYALLENLSYMLEESVGGITGGLYSVFFASGAKVFGAKSETCPIDAYMWLEALNAGIEGISRYGNAKLGDRTMLDALHNAAVALSAALAVNPTEPVDGLRMAAEAAQEAAKNTIGMRAYCGKASDIGDNMPLLMPDPGAHAVGIWMRALYEGCRLLLPEKVA